MKAKIKIAIVEDDYIYRMVLVNYLWQIEDFEVVFNCSNGKELTEVLPGIKLDVVLSDLNMPVMDGIKTTEYLNRHYPEIKILILTMFNGENLSQDLIEKGANIFLLKNNGLEQVPDAIYTLFKYEHYFAGWSLKKIPSEKNDVELTLQEEILDEQEKAILRFICKGLSSRQIGKEMFLSYRTIQNKRLKLHTKTNSGNLAELIHFAYMNKII